MIKGFSKEDASIIGFVLYCEGNAITYDEFKEFLYLTINNNSVDDLPYYIWDLIDLDEENKSDIYQILGFVSYGGLTKGEIESIYGIGIKRFGDIGDIPISKSRALKSLKENPHILKRFKETFPFIQLDF